MWTVQSLLHISISNVQSFILNEHWRCHHCVSTVYRVMFLSSLFQNIQASSPRFWVLVFFNLFWLATTISSAEDNQDLMLKILVVWFLVTNQNKAETHQQWSEDFFSLLLNIQVLEYKHDSLQEIFWLIEIFDWHCLGVQCFSSWCRLSSVQWHQHKKFSAASTYWSAAVRAGWYEHAVMYLQQLMCSVQCHINTVPQSGRHCIWVPSVLAHWRGECMGMSSLKKIPDILVACQRKINFDNLCKESQH